MTPAEADLAILDPTTSLAQVRAGRVKAYASWPRRA
jgi:hypothetical protein